MSEYVELFIASYVGFARYLAHAITHPGWHNFPTLLVAASAVVLALEQLFPWRRDQPRIRKDFWLDAFYMLFNVFIFSVAGYAALSAVAEAVFVDGYRALFGREALPNVSVASWPPWVQLLTMFLVRDFVHWNVHRLLHRVPFLWRIHKVHHSVEQMGFAAHLRYHWGETVVYRTLEYLPLALLGFGIEDFFVVHGFSLVIGHLNHANLNISWGPLRYVLNSPQMHIWHHTREQPGPHGCNFGISLSLWDWLFGTAWWPRDGRDEPLGFDNLEAFPTGFVGQSLTLAPGPPDPPVGDELARDEALSPR